MDITFIKQRNKALWYKEVLYLFLNRNKKEVKNKAKFKTYEKGERVQFKRMVAGDPAMVNAEGVVVEGKGNFLIASCSGTTLSVNKLLCL